MRREMGSGGRFIKTMFGVVVLLVFVWFLLVGILEGGSHEETKETKSLMKNMKVGGVERVELSDMINSMSKRRVPNGPDPIHNRKAGNSGRPPGQA
ncbi:hypothetical protein LguiB_016153 [Lonicera macranthoides]